MDNMAVMDQKIYEAEIRGEAKGIEKGKIEAQLDIAKNLLQSGIGMDLAIQVTGLSEEQIKQALESFSNLT